MKNINENESKNSSDFCLHLNYWIYDEIGKKIGNNSENLYKLPFVPYFNNVRDKNIIGNKSYCYHNFYENLNYMRQVNHLHHYIKNYNYIKKKFCSQKSNKEIFKKYPKDIHAIYMDHYRESWPFMNNIFLKYFSWDSYCNPNKFISEEECKDEALHQNPRRSVTRLQRQQNTGGLNSQNLLNLGYLNCKTKYMYGDKTYTSFRIDPLSVKASDYVTQSVSISRPRFTKIYE